VREREAIESKLSELLEPALSDAEWVSAEGRRSNSPIGPPRQFKLVVEENDEIVLS
jgi:hypothetical protein